MEALPRTPSFRLDGKRALVTGAGRGIGLGAAAALAGAGADVTLCARSVGEVETGAEAIRDSGGLAQSLELDVTRTSDVKEVLGRAGPFDILVNNAGTNRPKPFVEVSEEDYDAVLDLNLRAATVCATKKAARRFRSRTAS